MTQDAEVRIRINEREANEKLGKLEKQAERLGKKLTEAVRMNDTKGISDYTRELNKVNRQIATIRRDADNFRAAMVRLDQATPKELQKALRMINKELNSGRVKRGSREWNDYCEQLKRVKRELAEINTQMEEQPGLFSRIKDGINSWQTSIVAALGAFTGLVMSGKAAVNTFADMEAEEANVRKFTGMTAEEVAKLNEEFKDIDTRTAREELNRLAQEAGRLGKQSNEDVLGFVKAANQINVALDDLGDGATLTLSKLTGIFGDEERYGTEQSLLKVGSVINELSQNCSAAAPYLADFSKRLAGVGAQADMTIPQIMGYAAVLDTQGQAVEMSATAFSTLILKLYQEPAKFAKAAGIDVKEFSDLLKKDANEAIITLLESLNRMGSLQTLAPLFEEMGLDGARASGVISALAGNIDKVREQQQAANKAFAEGVSVTNEYEVQNNTVQAGLDKAKKKFTEMAVALGKELLPVMRYAISSTSMIMRLMLTTVQFIIRNRNAIIALTATIAAYTVAVKAAAISTKVLSTATAAYEGIVKGLMFVKNSLIVVMTLFTGGLGRATAAMRLLNITVKANPIGLLISVVGVAVTAISAFTSGTKDAEKAQSKLNKTISESEAGIMAEQRSIKTMFAALKKAKEGTAEYESIKRTIINQYGQYLKGLVDENDRLIDLDLAYRRVAESARAAAQARGLENATKQVSDDWISENQKRVDSLYKFLSQNLKDEHKGLTDTYFELIKTDIDKLGSLSARTADILKDALRKGSKTSNMATLTGMVDEVGQANRQFEKDLDSIQKRYGMAANEFENFSKSELQNMKAVLESQLELEDENEFFITSNGEVVKSLKSRAEALLALDRINTAISSGGRQEPVVENPQYTPVGETEKERKAREKAAREAEKAAREALRKSLSEQKAIRDKAEAENIAMYSSGQIDYRQFTDRKMEIDRQYLANRMKVYETANKKESDGYAALLKEQEQLNAKHIEANRKLSLREIERAHEDREQELAMMFVSPDSVIFQNQKALNQALLEEDLEYMRKKLELYQAGSEEWEQLSRQIEDRIAKDQLQKQEETAEALRKYSEEYRMAERKTRLESELALLEKLKEMGLISEEDYQRAVQALRNGYIRQENEAMQERIDERHKQLLDGYEEVKKMLGLSSNTFGETILEMSLNWKLMMDDLKHDGEGFWESFGEFANKAFAFSSALISQYTTHANAQRDSEIDKIEERYDKEIEAAGNNSDKKKALEKKKEKEVAKIKKKYNDRAMKIEIAQAMAQTAVNAILGYQAGLKVPPPGNLFMPAKLAAAALVQGAMQIATIKKQHEAQSAGYYDGGFTGGRNYRREAGVVHEGEFIANHEAVNNPALSPLLRMLDNAQRNNTVGSLTAEDVSIALGQGRGVSARGEVAAASAPPAIVTNNIDTSPIDRLNTLLESGIDARVTIAGEDGFDRKYKDYKRMQDNSKR